MLRNKIKIDLKDIFKNNQYSILKLKKISFKTYKLILEETSYITSPLNFNERIYHILNDLYAIPKCKMCTTNCKFININKGYQIYCSIKCSKHDPEIINKIRKTNIETYKIKKDEIKKKIKKSCLKKYGIEDPNQLPEIKNKIKQTKKERNINEKECLKKRIKTNLKNFKKEHYFQSTNFKDKINIIKKEKYNGIHPGQTIESKEKRKKTCLEKYGVDNPFKRIDFIDCKTQKSKQKFLLDLNKKIKSLNFILLDKNYIHNQYEHKWKCSKCSYVFINKWRDMCRGYLCLKCYPRNNTSIAEKEITELLKLYNINYIKQDRKIIYPKELDIYIPSKQIAIEYNGLYWHRSDKLNNDLYHLNKTIECNKKGIRLIHIFEDEWLFKQNIVKSRLIHILNVNNSKRIHGRKCIIKEIPPKVKNEFLEEFHIQGKDRSVIKLGAFYKDKLISIMTFSKGNIAKGSKSKEGIWELNRFCSHSQYHIPGIANKLLSYFKRNFKWKELFSYADRRWSDGNVYYKLGFKLASITQPNYWYIKNNKRIHRFNLRKRPDEPKDITEVELRLKEGYYRIWDCGHLKFINKKEI